MAIDSTSPKPIAERFFDSIYRAVDELSRRPVDLYLCLLALNALALPYANLIHDARLYGAQVLNRAHGARFADDLFFRYGSQDRFSVFSTVVAPLTSWFGLESTFFLLYLVFNALFLLALQRLVRALIEDRLVSTVALVFLAIALVPFGGCQVFHVNENFLTPRVIANTLVLFALERLLRDRLVMAAVLIAFAFLMHPLMALSGGIILVAWWALDHLKPSTVIGLAAVLCMALIGVLVNRPIGTRLFGTMDAEWLEQVRRVNAYNFPDEWEAQDWLSVLMSSLFILISSFYLIADRRVIRLLLLILCTALGGVTMMLVASHLPYALLLQAQPYRALWLLQLLQIPLGLLVTTHCWATGRLPGRCLALALVFYVGLRSLGELELAFLFGPLPFCFIIWHGLQRTAKYENWRWLTLLSSFCAGLVLWIAFKLAVVFLYRNQLAEFIAPLDVIRIWQELIDPLIWTLAALVLISLTLHWTGTSRRFRIAALGTFIFLQVGFYAVPRMPFYEEHWKKNQRDIAFVSHFMDRHRDPGSKVPTVYWSLGKADCIWFDLNANSYFEWTQIVGNLFSRKNAMEGNRRALLVRNFELDRFRAEQFYLSERTKRTIEAIFQSDFKAPAPDLDDLKKLCQERDVDYVIIKQKFDGFYTAGNGNFFIYDCNKLRSDPRIALEPAQSDNRADAAKATEPNHRSSLLPSAGNDTTATSSSTTPN